MASARRYSTIFLAMPSESRNSWTLKLRPLLDLMPAEYLPSGNKQCSQLNRRLDSLGSSPFHRVAGLVSCTSVYERKRKAQYHNVVIKTSSSKQIDALVAGLPPRASSRAKRPSRG